ncbi:MAG TPA: NAD(P)H-hydrate dehydratase [Gemmatimonadales bacterium]|nr:NAD(P)H-hydrate dehydratase [Gemmatimonadales bacterium]
MPSIPVVSPSQSSAWDRRAEHAGIALHTLMESAGRAAAAVLLREFAAAARQGVLVLAGTGHNGGDGWVMARALARLGVPVTVAPLAGDLAPLTGHVAGLARAEGVREVAPDGPWPNVGVVVDAILGTGAKGAPRAAAAALLDRAHDLPVPVLAVDGPSGLDLDTGVAHGVARADLTVTFGGFRRGHLLARDEVGEVVVVDIGHPPAEPGWPRFVADAEAASWLPPLHAADHKGDRGRVVVIGGDVGMTGAARLAGRAAFAAGAGLVHVVAPEASVAAIRAADPDLQTLAHALAGAPSAALVELLHRADVVVLGPGLGRADDRAAFVLDLLAASRRAVLDADALVALQGRVADLAMLARGRAVVLTPHAGEFRTLFPELSSQRETDPWGAADEAACRTGVTLLLKGVPTVVAQDGRPVLTLGAGNPGLATGGSGDVLSGILGAVLARDADAQRAAAVAGQSLGRAADLAARRVTARGMRPTDVIAALPDLWREWAVRGRVGAAWEAPVLARLPAPRTV